MNFMGYKNIKTRTWSWKEDVLRGGCELEDGRERRREGSGYDSGHIRCTPFHNPGKLHTNSSGFSAETPKVYCDTDFVLFSDRFAFSMNTHNSSRPMF